MSVPPSLNTRLSVCLFYFIFLNFLLLLLQSSVLGDKASTRLRVFSSNNIHICIINPRIPVVEIGAYRLSSSSFFFYPSLSPPSSGSVSPFLRASIHLPHALEKPSPVQANSLRAAPTIRKTKEIVFILELQHGWVIIHISRVLHFTF